MKYAPGPLDHIWNAHSSRSMFAICSWSSMLANMVLEHIINLKYSSRLLVHDYVVLDHKSRPKSQIKEKKTLSAILCEGHQPPKPTQQNSYSISHLLGTVTTRWLPLWRCSHCSLVPDTVTTYQWLHGTHMLLGIHYHGAYVEICLLGT